MQYFCPKCDQRFDTDHAPCPDCQADLLPLETAADLVGREIDGRFLVQQFLGEGGMGAVFVAHQKSVDRQVALKVLKRELMQDQTAVKRFLLEARAASRLTNVHTITIHDFGKTSDGLLYIAMELLKGESLRERLQQVKRMEPAQVARILDQVAESLAEAHEHGIVHRDLKPENVFLVRQRDGADLVKVLDFGIARARALSGVSRMTSEGMIVGTPAYLCPEAILGQSVDERADVYALGIMLYELLTGQVPFQAETPVQVLFQHVNQEPIPVHQANPQVTVPASLHRFLWACLAKRKEARPANAGVFREQLKRAMEAAAASTPEALEPMYTTSEGFRVSREALEYITTRKQALPGKGATGPRPPSRTGTPDDPGDADTLMDAPESQGGSEVLEDAVPRPRLGRFLALAAGLLVLAGVGLALLLRGSAGVQPGEQAAPIANAGPEQVLQPAAGQPEVVAPVEQTATQPTPEVTAPAAPREQVALTLVSVPPGAEVLVDGRKMGTTPWITRLDQGSTGPSVTLTLAGHLPETLVLPTDQDQVLERTLAPLKPAASAPTAAPMLNRPRSASKTPAADLLPARPKSAPKPTAPSDVDSMMP
jgi:serine/threonine-protein kinase